MMRKPPLTPNYSPKRLGKELEDKGIHPIQTVVSHESETVEVFVGLEEQSQAQPGEERQQMNETAEETGPDKRDEATSGSASFSAVASSNPSMSSIKAQRQSLNTRRARMRANRLLKLAPRFRAAWAGAAGVSKSSIQSETANQEGKDAPKQEIERLPGMISVEEKASSEAQNSEASVSETSFSSVFGKKYMAIREQSLDRRLLALERHLEQVSYDDDEDYTNVFSETRPNGSTRFQQISSKQRSNLERLATTTERNNLLGVDSIGEDSADDPLTSWLDERATGQESSDDSDEASHDTFHSFLVDSQNGNKFGSRPDTFSEDDGTNTDCSYDGDGDRQTFSFDSDDDDTHGRSTDESYSDGFTTEDGEETDTGSQTDTGSSMDENDEKQADSPYAFQSIKQALSQALSDADPFSQLQTDTNEEDGGEEEVEDGDETDTDVEVDIFQYKKGRFLVVI